MTERVDAIVVGAGPAGAVVTSELASAGMRVVCLEQGDWPDYALARSGYPDFELGARRNWNWDPNVRRGIGDYVVDDSQSDITALMYAGVGGSSVLYAAHWERFLPSDFRTMTLDAVGDDWPFDYGELAPYYDEVEQEFAVSGLDGDTAFPEAAPLPLPPVPLNAVGRRGAEAMNRLGWHWWPGMNAIATRDYRGLHACGQRTACPFGCPTGAKASADRTHWRRLVATGVELRTRAVVEQVIVDDNRLATGVVYRDENDSRHRLNAGVVVLAGNALGTPRILLNSRDGAGISNSSGLVGRRLMMHPFGNAIGVFDEDLESWRGPLGQYLHSLQFYETDRSRGFVRGAKWNLMPAGAPLSMMLPGLWGSEPSWGPAFTSRLRERFGRSAVWGVICEDLPNVDNRVSLGDPDGEGMPGIKIQYRTSANSVAMMDWHLARVREVLLEMGAHQVIVNSNLRGTGWHLMGTAVMGEDPGSSVVDPWGRSHDVPNLYVMDGSTFPTSSGVNPTATIVANALRCVRHLVASRAAVRTPA